MALLLTRPTISVAATARPISSFSFSSSISNSVKLKLAHHHPNLSSSISSSPEEEKKKTSRKLPILLFDVMDTIVRDPFYHDIPAFFRMSFNELIDCKHPTAWVDFEKGLINEMELARIFFKDGRPLDLDGLKDCMRSGFSYIDGVEALLHNLKQNNYEMHAFTNYPTWYTMIEDKLKISAYMSWTFCSCNTGKRKPQADSYMEVLSHLGVEPDKCIFIDDRMVNVEAAKNAGIVGIHFKDAASLQQELSQLGVETTSCSTNE
ncbi:HAD-like domain [Macleaya cordata]|uniref:HAD-like domain n=1 Tax=Macleaya cordata TaxID=56857 RepID=A0A200PU10_MACCD|nr:HAD-like domain [Macleaya cordata]